MKSLHKRLCNKAEGKRVPRNGLIYRNLFKEVIIPKRLRNASKEAVTFELGLVS